MPYSPFSSFNYSVADPFAGQFGQVANRGMDLAQTAADRGFGLADRRLDLTEAQQRWLQQFQQQQADRGFGLDESRFGLEKTMADRGYGLQRDQFGLTRDQQRFAQEAAIRAENEANRERALNQGMQVWNMPGFNRELPLMPRRRSLGAPRNPFFASSDDVYQGQMPIRGLLPVPKGNFNYGS